MKIRVNLDLKKRFVKSLQEKYSSSREGIHVSDLVYCLRQAFYRKTNPKPFSERQLGFFVDGARRHKVLQELLNVKAEVKVERWGIRGSIDLLLDKPLEIKTTRARASLPDHYFKQLGYYAVLVGVNGGYLVVQRLNSNIPWEFYQVIWAESEIVELRKEICVRAELLRQALVDGSANGLPKPDFGMEWKCKSCRHRDVCQNV